MSRARRMRIQRVRRNRRIAFVAGVVLTGLLLSILFSQLDVMAQKPTAYKYYTDIRVQRDDSLWSIAQEYMSAEYSSIHDYIQEVRQINSIGGEVVYGQHLMVPYYSEEQK